MPLATLLCPNWVYACNLLHPKALCSNSTSHASVAGTGSTRQADGSDPCPEGWGGRRRGRSGYDRGYDAARRLLTADPAVHLVTVQGPSPSDEQNRPGERRRRRARRATALLQARAAKATALLPKLLAKHRLVSLNLEFCRAASLLDAVAEKQHATLRQLNLNGVPDADPATVSRLLGSCSRLEVVGLFRHVRLGDDALAALPGTLRELSVSGCSLISDAGIKALVEHAPHLHFLDVTRCPELTDISHDSCFPETDGPRVLRQRWVINVRSPSSV